MGQITIDRTKPFEPIFVCKWFTIEKDETDVRSMALSEIDLTKVRFVAMLKEGETSITGEERLKRLKAAGYIRLDAKFFQTLWENKQFIPESWKQKVNGNMCSIHFDGTVLRDLRGHRCVQGICLRNNEWDWDCRWLDGNWNAHDLSAVLEISS